MKCSKQFKKFIAAIVLTLPMGCGGSATSEPTQSESIPAEAPPEGEEPVLEEEGP